MVRSLSVMRFSLRAISIKAISSCCPQLLKSVAESTGIYLFLPVCISENQDTEPSWCFWNVPAALTCRLTWIHLWMFPVTSPWRRMLVHRWLSMLFSTPIGVRTVRTKVYLRSTRLKWCDSPTDRRTSQPNSWRRFWSVICLETAAIPGWSGKCYWPSPSWFWTQPWTS